MSARVSNTFDWVKYGLRSGFLLIPMQLKNLIAPCLRFNFNACTCIFYLGVRSLGQLDSTQKEKNSQFAKNTMYEDISKVDSGYTEIGPVDSNEEISVPSADKLNKKIPSPYQIPVPLSTSTKWTEKSERTLNHDQRWCFDVIVQSFVLELLMQEIILTFHVCAYMYMLRT